MKKLLHLFILMSFTLSNSQTPIQEFNFDSSLSNTASTAIFTVTGNSISYGTDRNGVSNNAVQINGVNGGCYLTSNLTNLPIGNAARSISFWFKSIDNTNNIYNYPFGYGTQAANQAFGVQQNPANISVNPNRVEVYGFGPASNNIGVTPSVFELNTWYHYVITHDGINTTKIYRNNVLLSSFTKTWATTGTTVTIGRIIAGTFNDGQNFTGLIDDLKIYNTELTASQVATLYSSTSTVAMPTVSNVSATNIGTSSATINYTVNANNAATTTEIRYAVSPGGTLQTQVGPNVTGNINTNLTQNLTGLQPNTTYEYNVWAINSNGTAFLASSLNFTTLSAASAPVVSNAYSSTSFQNGASITFDVNPNGATTTTIISHTNVETGISSSVFGPTVTGNTQQTVTWNIGSLTSGECYTFNVFATNSAGNSSLSDTAGFCTLDANFNRVPFYHFKFNGNTQEENNATLMFQNPNSGFVDNNTAIRLNNNIQEINLPLLPQGFKKRTVAIRLMFESGALSQPNNVFGYGTATTNQSFGYTQNSASQATHYLWANDITLNNPMNFGTYYTMVFAYDGLDLKIYRDGLQIYSGSPLYNTIGTMLRLGTTTTGVGGFFNGRIDDLRIYLDYLSSSEVNTLTNTLSNENFNNNFQFSLYPNPANDILNVELKSELKSLEIYTLQGQKLLSSSQKQVNVSNLVNGVYMVRVEDENGAVSTQKLIKK